jgi:exodeoxyribonuclease VII small subunit
MSKIKPTEVQTTAPDFASAVQELEDIVALLESKQIPLEQSLAAYKRGAELLAFCQHTLADVEQQVRILNDAQLQAFEPAAD